MISGTTFVEFQFTPTGPPSGDALPITFRNKAIITDLDGEMTLFVYAPRTIVTVLLGRSARVGRERPCPMAHRLFIALCEPAGTAGGKGEEARRVSAASARDG
jgi:hypothetical protein